MVKRLPVTMDSGGTTAASHWMDQDSVDVAILSRIQSGDNAAYAPLWDRYWPWLCRYFRAQTGSKEEAEDLAGSTLLAAFEQLGRFRGLAHAPADAGAEPASGPPKSTTGRCTFKTYLGAIARHKLARCLQQRTTRFCRNFTELRGNAPEEESDTFVDRLMDSDPDTNPLSQVLQYERLEETFCALAYVGLRSNEQFKALLFHYACGLAHREVAEMLGLRDETVNTRLQEGRSKLSRYYQALSEEAAARVC